MATSAPLESGERELIRRFSRSVFGNRHSLEVLAAIGRGERHFYIQRVALETSIPSQTVRPVVLPLSGVLAEPLPRTGPTAPHYYERIDHPVWQMVVDLLDRLQTAAIEA